MQDAQTYSFRTVLAVVAVLAAMLLVWRLVFTASGADVVCTPAWLPPDGVSRAELRMTARNPLGFTVPFSSQRIRCEVIEGAGLARLSYNADSTVVTITAGVTPGLVTLRVFSRISAFPQLVEIPLHAPLAMLAPGAARRAA